MWFIVFNATFNNISVTSCRSVLLVEETGIAGKIHRPVASRGQTLSHNVEYLNIKTYDTAEVIISHTFSKICCSVSKEFIH